MFSIKNESKKTKITLLIFLTIFVCLCISSYYIHGYDTLLGSFEKMDNDDVKYLRSAWTLLETGKFTYQYPEKDTVFIMPGLTAVLSVFVKLFGDYPILAFRIFQCLLMTFGLYILFLTGRKIFNSKIALIGVALMVLYLPFTYVTHLILTETIFSVSFFLLFYISIFAIESKKMKFYIIGGCILGVMALFRPTIILYPIVIFIMWIIKKYKVSEMIKFALPVIIIVCTILSPWIIRNFIVFDKFIPLTLSSGNPMLQGTFINYDQSIKKTENINYDKIIRETMPEIDIDNWGKDEIVNDQMDRAVAKIRFQNVMIKEPVKYSSWYIFGKTCENFKFPFLWTNLFNIGFYYTFAYHWILLFLAIVYIITLIKNKDKQQKTYFWMAVITILYFNISHLPFFCFSRYMFPIMPLIIMFSANGAEKLYNKYKH